MRLYLIRHCESENNRLMRDMGREQANLADPGLTALGHKQAMILGSFLAGKNLGSKDKTTKGGRKRHHNKDDGNQFNHKFCFT